MSYELTDPDGDVIGQFATREEALAKAAAVLGVRFPIEGLPEYDDFRDAHVSALGMTRAHVDAGGGLYLYQFESDEA